MAENNVFPQSPPDSLRDLDEDLFLYLQEQATNLRELQDNLLYGQNLLDEGELSRFYTEDLYPLGTIAGVLHSVFGPMLIQFVQFDRMSVTGPVGHPVGVSVKNESGEAWLVTNDIAESTSNNTLGILGGTRIPKDGEFGWIIVTGLNPFPIVIEVGTSTVFGMSFAWVDDGNDGAIDDWTTVDGAQFARQVVPESFTVTMPAGALYITTDANSVSAISDSLQVQLTQLSLDLAGTNATVSTNQIAQVDGDTALGIRIDTVEVSAGDNSASITAESNARVAGDTALAETIVEVEASITNETAALISNETSARVAGDSASASSIQSLDARLTSRINTNQQTSANAETSIEALVTENIANVESTTRLEASLKEGSAENLLETNSESIQIGPLEYSTKILLSSVGLNPAEAISFGGRIFDPAPHNAVSTGWQIEFFDLLNNSLGTTDSNLVSFNLLEVGEFTADSTVITADSTFFNASMAGPSHRQTPKRENTIIPAMAFSFSFRSLGGTDSGDTEYGPVTLVRGPVFRAVNKVSSLATATESLSARVTVNESGITANANATTALAVTVTDNETAIGTNASAIVTLDVEVTDNTDDIVTAFAQWAVTLDVNGRVAGLVLVSTLDTESEFRVLVDKFQVFNGTSDEAVFEINGGVAQMKAANIANLDAAKITTGVLIAGIVDADNITVGTLNANRIQLDNVTIDTDGSGNIIIKSAGVDTAQLKDDAVTKININSSATNVPITAVLPTAQTVISVTVTKAIASSVMEIFVGFDADAAAVGLTGFIFRDTTNIRTLTGYTNSTDTYDRTIYDEGLSTGTYTYKLVFGNSAPGTNNVSNMTIAVKEFKK